MLCTSHKYSQEVAESCCASHTNEMDAPITYIGIKSLLQSHVAIRSGILHMHILMITSRRHLRQRDVWMVEIWLSPGSFKQSKKLEYQTEYQISITYSEDPSDWGEISYGCCRLLWECMFPNRGRPQLLSQCSEMEVSTPAKHSNTGMCCPAS